MNHSYNKIVRIQLLNLKTKIKTPYCRDGYNTLKQKVYNIVEAHTFLGGSGEITITAGNQRTMWSQLTLGYLRATRAYQLLTLTLPCTTTTLYTVLQYTP